MLGKSTSSRCYSLTEECAYRARADVVVIQTDSHIEVTPAHNGNLFFWHFQNKHIANKQRTVIWLNGGPGCSSMDGALMEIGPYRLKDDKTLEYNDGAWNEFANVMFVDNPVGTGFSYVDTDSYLHELDEMADQFIVFLEKWFAIFPEYEHDDVSHNPYPLFPSLSSDNHLQLALHRGRIIRRPTHPLHRKTHISPQQAPRCQAQMEPHRPPNRQRLDITKRAIRGISPIRLPKEADNQRHPPGRETRSAAPHLQEGACPLRSDLDRRALLRIHPPRLAKTNGHDGTIRPDGMLQHVRCSQEGHLPIVRHELAA